MPSATPTTSSSLWPALMACLGTQSTPSHITPSHPHTSPLTPHSSPFTLHLLHSQIFCDFGEEFMVFDSTGEQPISVLISHVSKVTPPPFSLDLSLSSSFIFYSSPLLTHFTCPFPPPPPPPPPPPQEERSVVTCSDETRHNFQSGDYVTFSEIEVCPSSSNVMFPPSLSL